MSFNSNIVSIGSASGCNRLSALHPSFHVRLPDLPCLQKAHCIESLLDIRHLIFQASGSSLLVGLHELVFAAHLSDSPQTSIELACIRNHLLKLLQRGLDICSRLDIVLNFVDKGRIWDASWVCRLLSVGILVSKLHFFSQILLVHSLWHCRRHLVEIWLRKQLLRCLLEMRPFWPREATRSLALG